jgi:hypothetical protein
LVIHTTTPSPGHGFWFFFRQKERPPPLLVAILVLFRQKRNYHPSLVMYVSNNNTTEQYWLLSVWHTCWISFLLARFSPPRSDQRHPMVRTVISLINWQYCRGHEGCVCMHVHSLTVFVVVLSFVPQVYSPRWVLFLVWVKCESKPGKDVLFLTGGSVPVVLR